MQAHAKPAKAALKRDEIVDRLRETAAKQMDLPIADVQEGSRLQDDLGMDSLDVVEFQMAAEEILQIEVPEDMLDPDLTIGAAATIVLERLGE